MEYSPTELEAVVRLRAPQIAGDIRQAAQQAQNEADLVAEVEKLLDKFAASFDLHLHPQRERTLVNGRADAVYNRFVIEYEPPRSLDRSNAHRNNQHAVGQVKQYMEGLERLDRHRKERLAGVVLDGSYFIFVRYRDEHWRVDDPLPVDEHNTATFLRYLLSLSTETALTPEYLVRDFGENSNVARHVVPALYRAITTTTDAKAEMLFEQWQRQFREVSGYDPEGGQLDVQAVARLYAVRDASPDVERLFFAIHTYYATFIKVLALQIAYYYMAPKLGSGLAAVASYPSEKLRAYLQDMERGGLFGQLGIRNFLEGDFFGWYLDIWDESLYAATQRLIAELAGFSLVTLDVDPDETRDLLKHLYQNLMPKKLRHALGEYYTPDWLAERLLNQLGYNGDPSKRLLDPACGSGTFLVLAIKRVRQYADEKGLNEAAVLGQVLSNVVGYDLNPLAVISARTNYLLALGSLLQHRRGDVSIPVYLADSILTPSRGDNLFTAHGFRFNTVVGSFTVPTSLVDARYINSLADLLEECVHSGTGTEQFKARLVQALPIDVATQDAEMNIAVALYEQLLELERKGINGIWARIIKNAFAPLFQGQFDYVAGNPPWINWESLPTDYRQETIPLWMHHNLFPHGGMDTILGKGKKDISMLLTYVAADNYLSEGGKLGFIITQSVLKNSGSGEGFRRLMLGSGVPAAMLAVDDMVEIQPFEGAANRTAVIILRRNQVTRFPVAYNVWRKAVVGKRVPEDASLDEALAMCSVRQFVAEPMDQQDAGSPWLTGRPHALRAVRRVMGGSDYEAHEGCNTGGANGVYWVEAIATRPDGLVVVSNVTEGAKRKVESVQAAIEPDLLYPLLRGRDVQRWSASPNALILMVQDPNTRRGYDEGSLQVTYPKTYAYLKRFEKMLRQRAAYKRYFKQSDAFYSMFNVGQYTFAQYQVVWREQAAGLVAAVVPTLEGRPVVPDHKLMAVGLNDEMEADYLCAALNSSPAQLLVLSYAVTIQLSTHILEHISVPLFSAANSTHVRLASESRRACAATESGDVELVGRAEMEIDRLVAKLWGLTEEELREIRESLAELMGAPEPAEGAAD